MLGRASSGKSAWAERLVEGQSARRCYVATSRILDGEIGAKVALHVARRGPGWRTVEAGSDAVAALHQSTPEEAVLFDCATMWLTNLMMDGDDWTQVWPLLEDALRAPSGPVTVVSNELGGGIIPDNSLARQFQRDQGMLNQNLAEAAERVVFVTAGLPSVLKGAL